ncbi:C45 family autoproteolytic acyltransferase/hydolase [Planomicrobium sp. CPCC 101110]|uniref:C45 family autoproteolytic acyltransferase/hydolase n=1 Tax=Planomicrobium sp. CPCC 101110 TaxID=2599619 RepID=UPI0011B59D05|nr:C45 family peptidase [Planomicrobium sp. CPCC 101110]TWT24247.1 linear amide C-N hydrolase [Planomicrobium sp. CPCC 101110]
MGRVHSDVIQFRGNHYDFGFEQGQMLRSSFILPNRKKQWGPANRNFTINEQEAKKLLLDLSPAIWEEICGLADALEWPMYDAIKDFGGYYLEYVRSGCSIFTAPDFMVRNYDSTPDGYEGRFALYQPTDGGYATIGPTMQITGRTDGINEKGLAMGYNFINRRNSGDGFICNMIGRLILENCATIEDAIALLKEIPHRRSFSYVLLDQSGETKVVEASPRDVRVRDASISTNHFELLTEENRYQIEDSRRREQTIQNHQQNLTDAFSAFQLLNDSDKGVFSKKYATASGTLHTAAYFPETLEVGFALGPNRLPLMLDFKKWLKGDKLYVKRINGNLDIDAQFVNMAEI